MLTDLCYFGLICACLGSLFTVVFGPYVRKIRGWVK